MEFLDAPIISSLYFNIITFYDFQTSSIYFIPGIIFINFRENHLLFLVVSLKKLNSCKKLNYN